MNKVDQGKPSAFPLLSGLFYAFLWMGLAAFVISMLLLLTGMKEQSLTLYAYLIHGWSTLAGGFVSGRKSGSKGWYIGGMLGILYAIAVILISFLGFDAPIRLSTLYLPALAFTLGALGGMVGVNSRK